MSALLITGGSSAAGIATATELVKAGHTVVTAGSHRDRIEAAAQASGAAPEQVDLRDPASVAALRDRFRRAHGALGGLIHLVGGWRGGGGLAGQTDADWDFLDAQIIQTLRVTTREFADELGPDGAPLVLVSSTGLGAPTPGNANYLAAKGAAEAWALAVGDAKIIRVKALVDDAMRAARPDRSFPGYTPVTELARQISEIF